MTGKKYIDKLTKENIKFYQNKVEQHGISYKSLNWGSKQSQELRFNVLQKIGELNSGSLLDFGCGTGDFLQWLINKQLNLDYTGIDITQGMIDICKTRFPNYNFLCKNIFDEELKLRYDYILMSGVFTYTNFDFFKKCIEILFKNSKKGIGFNVLNKTQIDPILIEDEFSMDPFETIDFCMKYTKKIIFDNTYHKNDFTIFMYK
jgi:SAM-dependent methyltransferase